MEKGALIKFFRQINGLSQDNIAVLYGVKQRNVSMIESSRFLLRSDLVNCITQVFFISPQYYHFNAPPIFISDVVFFSTSIDSMREMEIIAKGLHNFIEDYKISKAFLVNENVLVLNANNQYIFILSNFANKLISSKTSDNFFKTISIDIKLTDNDIERYFYFPFPKEKVSEFIKLFFSIEETKFIFNPRNFKELIEESKEFIVKKIKSNKILEILEIMEDYKITSQDIKSYDPYEGIEWPPKFPPLNIKELKKAIPSFDVKKLKKIIKNL